MRAKHVTLEVRRLLWVISVVSVVSRIFLKIKNITLMPTTDWIKQFTKVGGREDKGGIEKSFVTEQIFSRVTTHTRRKHSLPSYGRLNEGLRRVLQQGAVVVVEDDGLGAGHPHGLGAKHHPLHGGCARRWCGGAPGGGRSVHWPWPR